MTSVSVYVRVPHMSGELTAIAAESVGQLKSTVFVSPHLIVMLLRVKSVMTVVRHGSVIVTEKLC